MSLKLIYKQVGIQGTTTLAQTYGPFRTLSLFWCGAKPAESTDMQECCRRCVQGSPYSPVFDLNLGIFIPSSILFYIVVRRGDISLVNKEAKVPHRVLLGNWSQDCFTAVSSTVLSSIGWKMITFYQLWIDYLSFSLNVSLAKENRASNLPFCAIHYFIGFYVGFPGLLICKVNNPSLFILVLCKWPLCS